jgi:hypothetical protein
MPECIVCLEDSKPGDLEIYAQNRMIRLCMSSCECNGFVHVQCLRNWISQNPTNRSKCPICRTEGENYTLLETEQSPIEVIVHTPVPTQPRTVPIGLPTIHEEPPPITYQNANEPDGFNIDQAVANERRDNSRRCYFGLMIISVLIVMLLVWSSFISNDNS